MPEDGLKQMSAATLPKSRSDNVHENWHRTYEIQLVRWRPVYPTISALYDDLENCSELFARVAKTFPEDQILRHLLDRWQSLGRPDTEWPESEQED